MQGPMVDALYPGEWYNNQNFTEDEMGYILYENKLLGAPRLRQVRPVCWVLKCFRKCLDLMEILQDIRISAPFLIFFQK